VWDRCTCGCWLTGRVAGTVALLAVGLSKRQEQARCAMREDNEYSSAPLASGISAQPPRRARLLRAARLSHRHGGPGQEESPKTPLPSAYGGGGEHQRRSALFADSVDDARTRGGNPQRMLLRVLRAQRGLNE
jgi:hypothetical protein